MAIHGDVVAHPTMIYLLAGAAIAIYIASKAAVDALVGRSMATSGRLALGYWFAIAAVALTALWLNAPGVAVSVVFASSVVCLTLGVGSVVLTGKSVGYTSRRPASMMLLPASVLAFLAGFHGRLTFTEAGALFLTGIMALRLWVAPEGESSGSLALASRGTIVPRAAQALLAVLLAIVGGWAAVRGMTGLHPTNGIATPALLTVTLLAPLLVLPMLSVGIDLAYRRQSVVACDGLIGVVLLNLCLLLPMCVVTNAIFPAALHSQPTVLPSSAAHPTPGPTTNVSTTQKSSNDSHVKPALNFPLVTWRIDAVALVVLAVLLLPITQGRWPLTRGDGIGLIIAYLLYVLLAISSRLHLF